MKRAASDKTVELQVDRFLIARMMVVAMSRPETNLSETVGKCVFSVIPRAAILHSSSKSSLMAVLQKLFTNIQEADHQEVKTADSENPGTGILVAIIDGMAKVQCLKKNRLGKTKKKSELMLTRRATAVVAETTRFKGDN